MSDESAPFPEKKGKRPRITRACPKCASTEAYGPQFRAADHRFPVDRLRFDCVVCGFISCEPTADATPERRALVAETQANLLERWSGRGDYVQDRERQPVDNRSREVADIIASETRPRRRWSV